MAAAPFVRRELRRQVRDPSLAEDLAQEVLARLLAAADRLDPATMGAYARVVARNAARTHQRNERYREQVQARAATAEAVPTAGADEEADLGQAESQALRRALEGLSVADRQLLEDHAASSPDRAVDEEAATPGRASATPESHPTARGTARVRLLRARARARVRYLLALRGLTPASDRCLPALDALSAGDRARQRAVGVESHLAGCELCASLAEEVVRRQRPLPVLVLLGGTAALWRALRRHPAVSAAGASAAVAAGLLAANTGGDTPSPITAPTLPEAAVFATTSVPPPRASLATADRDLLPVPTDAAAMVGAEVRATGATVRTVVGDEAFWVSTSDDDQLLVVLAQPLESPVDVAAGQLVDFTGRLAANPPGFAATVGVDATEGLEQLTRQGVHIDAADGPLQIR